ncbi:MAG: parvulin peptidyl-prolyl isomerase [Calditrichaeota bacterium]|nr:parvulin peptidyl-prolyl isomerase [Calditrichota bacterium]
MKNKIFLWAILLCVGTVNGLFSQQVIDRIAAIVEDDVILSSELTQYSLNMAFQLGIDPRKNPDKFVQLEKRTLQNLINQKILLAKAEEDSVEVDERQVDSVLEEQIKNMIKRVGSEAELEKQLGMSIGKIKRKFRDDVRNNLRVERLRGTMSQKITISRREVEEFYKTMKDSIPEIKETVDISHILLNVKPGEAAEKEALARIKELQKRIQAGEDFAELCRQYSEDPGSKARGGELGFIQRGDFVPEFEEVAFMLKPGEISDIVKTRFGYHIIQCIERRGDKINVRHLLILLQPTKEDEKRTYEKALKIRKMLDEPGADFAEIAKKYSDDETSRDQGGHLGKFEVDNLQEKEFKNVIESLEVGEISQPFKTRFGWHILKLNDRQDARKISIEKDWDQLEAWALKIKQQREFQKWLDDYKKNVYVEIKMKDSDYRSLLLN